jgi:hypothetical protein
MSDEQHNRAGVSLGRRDVLRLAALAASVGAVGAGTVLAPSAAQAATIPSPTSVTNAYAFLAGQFDQYGTGTALRLPSSYKGGYLAGFISSFAYDDALVILAWLAGGTSADRQRATVLGDSLIHAQSTDPFGDGRTRASYQPDSFRAGSTPEIGSAAANTGNQAWVGMALTRLHEVTGQRRFLDAALRLANWIQTISWDGARAPFGYTGGRDANNMAITYKASEHNIDVGAFFTMLGTLTGNSSWTSRAQQAYAFVAAMQSTGGWVWTGTGADGTTINTTPIPADVQTWAYLATHDTRYTPAVNWVIDNLMNTDAGITGSSYSNTDTSKVWLEGSGHLALAVRARGAAGDTALYNTLMTNIEKAQTTSPNQDGRGIVAASTDGLQTGFGDTYYASLHTGATAFYVMAAKGYNPFRL